MYLCVVDETVVHRSEVPGNKLESKFLTLSSESSNAALRFAIPDQCTPSEPMWVPFSPNSILEDLSVSHFTRRLPGFAQWPWQERDACGRGVENSAPCRPSHKTMSPGHHCQLREVPCTHHRNTHWIKMVQCKDLKPARGPHRLDAFSDIRAPIVKKMPSVNGKDKWSLTPAKLGVITIYSDDDNEKTTSSSSSRPRAVKRERSRIQPRVVAPDHHSSQPRVKRESSVARHGPQRTCEQTPPASAVSGTRRTIHEALHRREGHAGSGPPSDSPSSSESSGSDSSDSSESEDESDSSSSSSSSGGSSSEDEASFSVYRPTTPASSLAPSPPRTRRMKDTGVRGASDNPATASPSRRSMQNESPIVSGHAPLDFFIDLPARPSQNRPELTGRSRSHTSSAVASTGAQVS